MSAERNKQIIRDIYAAMENGDQTLFGQHVSPDYVWRFPSKATWSHRFEGQDQIRSRLLGPLFSLFSGPYTAKVINLVAEGDTVVAEIEGHAPLKTGEIYDNQYCMLFKFRDGKIVEVVEYCDTGLEERKLGPYEDVLRAYQQAAA